MTLRVVEIFRSIQGESTRAGQPCVFIRLAGCDVGCTYCDTPEARSRDAGVDYTVDQVFAEVLAHAEPLVEITGGEPLLQREAVIDLSGRLLGRGLVVMLETSGSEPVEGLDERIEIVMDVKTPGSGAAEQLCEANLAALDDNDEVKFVLTGREDYDWARDFLSKHDLRAVRAVHFSPAWGSLEPAKLAGWMMEDRTEGVRLGVQLHRLLGVR